MILGYTAQIRGPSPAGHHALLLVRFATKPCAPALAFLRAQPEVQRYWSVKGSWDAVVEVEVQNASALSALIDRLAAWPGGIGAESMTALGDFIRAERTML